MSLPAILRPEAETDLEAICDYLGPGASGRFLQQFRELMERIEVMPEIFGVVWQDVRAVRLKKFRYVIYYVAFDDRVEVLAVMHGSRDPALWQLRR